jgi:hypothetical protein
VSVLPSTQFPFYNDFFVGRHDISRVAGGGFGFTGLRLTPPKNPKL